MKVTVTKTDVSVEGDAGEIRQAMPSILGTDQPAAIVVKGDDTKLIEAETVVKVAPDPSPQPFRVPETGTPELVGEILPSGPFESPHDIPAEWRWFNDTGMTCHIRTQPGVAVSMCPQSRKKIGARRLHDTEVPFKNTEVCEGCVRAVTIAGRPA